jgi:cytochrome c oxidase subunit 4
MNAPVRPRSLSAGVSGFGALMVLLGATVAVSFVPLGPFGVVAALTIAFAKALLIVLFFMHVRYADRLTMIMAAADFFWLIILFLFTFSDYLTRGWAP